MNKRIILLIFFSQFSIERIISGYPAGNAGIELTFRTKPIPGEYEMVQATCWMFCEVTGTQCCLPDVHVAVSHQRSKEEYHSGQDTLSLNTYLPAGPLSLQAERPGASSCKGLTIKSQGLTFMCKQCL